MKLFLSLLIIFACCANIFSQNIQIEVQVTNSKSKEVKLILPVQGNYFWANEKKEDLGADNSLLFTYSLDKAGLITVVNEDVVVRLFVQLGDKLKVQFNPAEKKKPFIITGANAEGQNLLNARPLYYQQEADQYLTKDTVVSSAIASVKADRQADIKVLNELYAQK